MDYCRNCGQELSDKDKFCPSCDTMVDKGESVVHNTERLESIDYRGSKVRLCEDGKYRWVYKMNMITNPSLFLSLIKVFFYIILVGFVVFGTFIYAIHGNWAGLWDMAKSSLIALGVLTGLGLIGLLVLAINYRGKYIVLFEMDEHGVKHIQVPEQFRKAQKLGKAAALGGMLGGSFTTAGAGMLMASKNAFVSEFTTVRRVKPHRRMNVIEVNELLEKNRVYVTDEDFDFVYDYIKSRCVNAK